RTAAVQNLRKFVRLTPSRSVLECGSPLPLSNFRLQIAHSRLAESESKNNVACDCRRRMEAGQAVLIGPRRASRTEAAFRFSGAMQSIFLAEQRAGIVSVKAYCGTAAMFGKWPSLT